MPPLGGPGPRRVNAGAVKRRARNIARTPAPRIPAAGPPSFPRAVPKRPGQIVTAVPKAHYKPTAPAQRGPTPAQLRRQSRIAEKQYKSQAGAVRRVAKTQAALGPGKAVRPAKGQQILRRADLAPLIQEQSYKSLGEAVAKAKPVKVDTTATLEKASPKLRAAIATNPKLKTQLSGMLAAGKGSDAAIAALKEQKIERGATVQAPALKALDVTMRPGYAVLGSVKKDIERGGVGEAFSVHAPGSKAAKQRRTAVSRGFSGKERTTGSDVLGAAGWKPKGGLGKAARAAAGLGLDIAANPLSYTQAGTGTVAERAGATAARKALGAGARGGARRATIAKIRQVGGEPAVSRAAQRARTQAERKVAARAETRATRGLARPVTRQQHEAAQQAGRQALEGKGVTIRFAGQEIPGIRRVTAAAGRGAGRVAPTRAKTVVRRGVRAVRPMLRAQEYPAQQFEAGLRAAAGSRAGVAHAERRALTLGQHLKANLPKDAYDDVIRALERNDIKSLPAEYRDTAIDLRSALRHYHREGSRAGVIKGKVGDFGNWLKKGEIRKLLRTVESETGAQARRTGQAGIRLERAGSRVKVAETEAAGRQRVSTVRLTEQERRRTQLARQREIGSAGVSLERRRGGEALTGQRQLQTAQRQLKAELAKPVAKRRGVAALEANVRRLRAREPSDRLVAAEERLQTARQPAAPVTARERLAAELRKPVAKRQGVAALEAQARQTAPVPTARVQRAVAAHGERVQELEAQVARSRAAKGIPAKSRLESDEQYLRRLRDHARTHNLPLIEQRATQLLEAKPQMTRGYFPREFESRINKRFGVIKKSEPVGKETGRPLAGTSKKVSRITPGYRRAEQRPLHQVNAERKKQGLEPFSTDVPVTALNYGRETGKATAEAGLAQKLGDIGRQYKPPTIRAGESIKDFAARRATAAQEFTKSLGEGERLYFVGTRDGRFDLHEADTIAGKLKGRTSAQAQKRAEKDPGRAARQALEPIKGESGRYVALNEKMVQELRAHKSGTAASAYDRLLGRWKGLAIANPAFHIRNLVGDIHTASYEQPLLNLLGRTGPQAAKAIRRESALGRVVRPTEAGQATKFQRGARKLGVGVPGKDATIKVAGKRQPLDDFLKAAHEDGIIDAGFVGAEVHTMINQGVEEVRRVGGPAAVKGLKGNLKVKPASALPGLARRTARWTRNRENITRLATYKGALDRGLSRAEARRLTSELHVDYAHLSEFERTRARRVAPFYTWTARSIPLTGKKLVTRPGKFAAYESAREETAKAFGVDPQQATSQMSKAVQSTLPFTVRLPGRKEPVALSWSDPMTLLGDLPTSKEFPHEAGQLAARQLAPFPKWAIELAENRNLATRKDISGKHVVTAPSDVVRAIETGAIPEATRRRMKIIPPRGSIPGKPNVGFVDYKTGKPAWGWSGTADYIHDQAALIGLGGQVAAVFGAGRSPTQEKLQSVGALAGARFDPLDKNAVKYAGQQRLRKEADKLNSRQQFLRDAGINSDRPTPEYKRNLKRLGEINKTLYPRVKKPRKTSGLGGGGLSGGGLSGGGLSGGGL